MSLFTDFAGQLISGFIGGGGPKNVATATSSTDVVVNPQIDITSINVVDLEPVANLVSEIKADNQAQGAELRNVREDMSENLKLIASGALLFFALNRRNA